ncbi:ABC transporter permease [Kordiimonas sp. SCSIO 12610]|uniref:ABC transporter permease n=1 Tax=Kordiimonas sp. SCSIO 12610 TaxID=2829597 RepID=UPI00210C074B|nr:ABC transporter permease [Kordiimonas sp. SCSIO 12610]UTW56037.1 ABC transporter permease [Kordiimonas sp. SCSIO 12610]
MLWNYLRTAWRHLIKNRAYSVINILGLAIGLMACMLIMLYVQNELSYDQHWTKSGRLVQLNSRFSYSNDRVDDFDGVAGPFKHALTQYFPNEIEQATRLYTIVPVILTEHKVTDQQVIWADPETFTMFEFDTIAGSMDQVFADSRTIGLSETVANTVLGSSDVINQVITLEIGDRREDFRVGAVYADLPDNTTLHLPAIALFDENASFPGYTENWWNIRALTYFELKDGASLSSIETQLNTLVDTMVPHDFFADANKPTDQLTLSAINLSDVHLYGINGSVETVSMMALIALLILVIASINFINLSTAKGSQRAREVALRKTLGAKRTSLIIQFLGESILMVSAAMLFGVFFLELVLPFFNDFLGKQIALDYTNSFALVAGISIILIVGVLGGVYPAYILSDYRPAETLKSTNSESTMPKRVRSALVIIQFTISISLIVAASLIYVQREYAINLDPGFNQENLLTVQYLFRGDTSSNRQILKNRILNTPGVTSATFSANTPPYGAGRPTSFTLTGSDQTVTLPWQDQDSDYFSVYQIPMVAGRAFPDAYAENLEQQLSTLAEGEEANVDMLVNESAAKLLGFNTPEEALGKTLKTSDLSRPITFTIIGVVGNTRFNSIRRDAPPQFYTPSTSHISLTLRYTSSPDKIAADLKALWQDLYPEVPLYYYFVEDAMREAFDEEVKISTLLSVFSALAVIVACLGLYGLAAYNTDRRAKEVGIRKVMGANVKSILNLFLWQFAKPVLIANIIAWPLISWIMLNWLETFPYRIDAWVIAPLCLGAGVFALMTAWITVGGHVIRTARKNPVHSLRYE